MNKYTVDLKEFKVNLFCVGMPGVRRVEDYKVQINYIKGSYDYWVKAIEHYNASAKYKVNVSYIRTGGESYATLTVVINDVVTPVIVTETDNGLVFSIHWFESALGIEEQYSF